MIAIARTWAPQYLAWLLTEIAQNCRQTAGYLRYVAPLHVWADCRVVIVAERARIPIDQWLQVRPGPSWEWPAPLARHWNN